MWFTADLVSDIYEDDDDDDDDLPADLHTEFIPNILNGNIAISVSVRLQNKWVQRSGILLPV